MSPVELEQALNEHRRQQLERSQQPTSTESAMFNAVRILISYLDGHTTKTEVVNQLQAVGTPDVANVVAAVDSLHNTLKTHKNTDLGEITAVMKSVLEETKKIPKGEVKIPEVKLQDYSGQFKSLESAISSIERAVKAQKLIAPTPVVNVPEAHVNVAPPNLDPLRATIQQVTEAVKSIDIPEFKQDNSTIEKLLKNLDKRLKDLPGQMPSPSGVMGGGGGGAAFKDTTGNFTQAQLTVDGKVPVDATITATIDKTGLATDTGQNTGNASLSTIAAKDFATQTTLALIKAKTDNLDVALSTRTKPADQQHVIVDSTATAQPLTDTQLRATAVPISVATIPTHAVTLASTTITGTVATLENRPASEATTNVTNSTSNQTALASNANRRMATFYNDDTLSTGASVYLKCGATASATSFKVKIAPGGYYELPGAPTVYTGIIDVIATANTGTLRTTETT